MGGSDSPYMGGVIPPAYGESDSPPRAGGWGGGTNEKEYYYKTKAGQLLKVSYSLFIVHYSLFIIHMTTPPNIDSFITHVKESLPKGLLNLHEDLEKNFQVALDSALRRMKLVTREEFEIQSAILAKTRSRLEALEAQVAVLEAARLPKQEMPDDPSE